mgnify:CR=1 FL=1
MKTHVTRGAEILASIKAADRLYPGPRNPTTSRPIASRRPSAVSR